MKLYNSMGPNPKVVRMYMAEQGIDIEKEEVDLMAGDNRQAPYMTLNPAGTMPALELDNGSVISEITVLCEYLDEQKGHTPLIGTSAEQRAETRMWCRRIDLGILENLANGFRSSEGLGLFKDRLHTIPHAADDLKAIAQEKITWLDGMMEGADYVCGDRFSLADIMLFCFLEFGTQVGQPLNSENSNITAWYDRVAARDSASA
jgi:glutathione S-transferase